MQPSRVRPSGRVATPSDKTPTARTETFAAPIDGWVTNENLALQGTTTALVLDNFWPTATGVEPRGGSEFRVSVPGAVRSIFEYRGGETPVFFAATDTAIYEFLPETPTGATLTNPEVSGQTSGSYIQLETQTDGGSYLTVVNGADHLQIYDGTDWQQVTDVSEPFSITGVDTRRLAHVWSYNNRQFYIERGSLNAWYLGINSVAGPAERLPLTGIFRRGGSLLFGASWSDDSGDDSSDRCVFVTDRGEFAVYQGDPSSAATWQFAGVYDIGTPLGPDAALAVGGDLIIATQTGLIPVSAAVQKDVGELELVALSRPIGNEWRRTAQLTGFGTPWRVEKWAERNMALVVPPMDAGAEPQAFVVNLETRAWARFLGWSMNDLRVLAGQLHFGGEDGRLLRGDTGGTDDGAVVSCSLCWAFTHLGAPGAFKTAHSMRGVFRHTTPFVAKLSVTTDYRTGFPTAPNSLQGQNGVATKWDVAAWDAASWAATNTDWSVSEKWEAVSGQGYALAAQLQVTSGATTKLGCELISVDLVFTTGDTVV
ncbi:hypothetical protein [Epibacterium ulvae]|uniref:hypothetical protein n=1 Tax=Epibacterium ulvae TaxID=1156985 RepID=UPI001BFC8F4E|nr:hypothetical protein [Epibacterium ulvae]